MDCISLTTFRQGLYDCFDVAADALMNTCDALLSESGARSFAELSLSPLFVRRWPSLYAAVQDAQVDRSALRQLFVAALPPPGAGQRLVLGVDASPIMRPLSHTARDRTYVHATDAPQRKAGVAKARGARSAAQAPVGAGWNFSAVAVLPATPSSWTYLLDNQRIESTATPATVAAQQLAIIVPLLNQTTAPAAPAATRALVTGDRYYGSATFVQQTKDLPCDKLLRCQSHRVFYRLAPPPTGRPGAPRKDGPRFKCNDPATHEQPDHEWSGLDDSGALVEVSCWHNLHFRECREVTLSVLRVVRHGARDSKRDPRTSWFIWVPSVGVADTTPPLDEIAALYGRRFSLEHGFRFDKQNLLWAKPRLRTPEQYQTWTDVVAAVRNQLVLARPRVQAQRQPWERAPRPTGSATPRMASPQQVRRAMGRIMAELGTPAQLPQPRGKSPGRPLGASIKPAPRFPIVYKSTVKPYLLV